MDISNWANSGSFTLSNQLNLKATKSIAQSRAETKLTYRSKTSKIDRRKYKSQALKQKLEYDGKMSQISRKSEKNKMKLMDKLKLESNVAVSGAQADVAMYVAKEKYLEKKRKGLVGTKDGVKGSIGSKVGNKLSSSPNKTKKQENQNNETVDLLKQLKDSHMPKKKVMKKGYSKKKDTIMLSQIQMMNEKMKSLNS